MSDNIQNINGVDMFAFDGERNEVWHRKGQSARDARVSEMSPEDQRAWWSKNSGHDFIVDKVPAIAHFGGVEGMEHLPAFKDDTGVYLLARRNDGHIFAPVTKTYQTVQPETLDDFFNAYIAFDPRFKMDAMGALGDGERIWSTARFETDLTVAGDSVIPRLLMSTSYDATMATRVEATTTRVVCENTLRAAWASDKAVIKVSHRTAFNEARVQRELAQIVQSFDTFKAMGDAMARVSMSQADCATFLKNLIDIPLEAQRKDVSTRSLNILGDLENAVNVTMRERNTRDPDAWCLLNGVTRYVDHSRTVRTDSGARSEVAARFDAGMFGSGDAMKGKAVQLLMPMVKAYQLA